MALPPGSKPVGASRVRSGVPSPQTWTVHPYPTRYHGGIWVRPQTSPLPYVQSPQAVFKEDDFTAKTGYQIIGVPQNAYLRYPWAVGADGLLREVQNDESTKPFLLGFGVGATLGLVAGYFLWRKR